MYQDTECEEFSDDELIGLSQSQNDDEDYFPSSGSSESDCQDSTKVNQESQCANPIFIFEGIRLFLLH